MPANKKLSQLGGLTAKQFLRDYWQKKPLLIRNAFPNFVDPLNIKDVLSLSTRDEAESRLVTRRGKEWQLQHGPFSAADLRKIGNSLSTILIQDTQHFSIEAEALLRHFYFIGHARIDDLMVSYARPGAGVGPHVDSYDVFLLQGQGSRRWQISSQHKLAWVENAPLKLLKNFKPEHEWLLESGDMLYLPPGYSHNGIAESECLTWSIGFRAPSNQELAIAFLDFIRDEISLDGGYHDADLKPADQPGEMSQAMIQRLTRSIRQIRFANIEYKSFIGRYLTEPKPHVFFENANSRLTRQQFARKIIQWGVRLDLKTRMLFSNNIFFMNGDEFSVPGRDTLLFKELANHRELSSMRHSKTAIDILYKYFKNGFVKIGQDYESE